MIGRIEGYVALDNLRHNGDKYAPGDALDIDDFSANQLNQLVADGVIAVGMVDVDKADTGNEPDAGDKTGTGNEPDAGDKTNTVNEPDAGDKADTGDKNQTDAETKSEASESTTKPKNK